MLREIATKHAPYSPVTFSTKHTYTCIVVLFFLPYYCVSPRYMYF